MFYLFTLFTKPSSHPQKYFCSLSVPVRSVRASYAGKYVYHDKFGSHNDTQKDQWINHILQQLCIVYIHIYNMDS